MASNDDVKPNNNVDAESGSPHPAGDARQTYQDLFNSVEDAILIQDSDGTFLDVNKGAQRLYGYSKKELVGKNALFLADKKHNDLEKTSAYFEEALQGESQKFEWWGRSKNGKLIPTEIILNSGTYFGKPVVYAIARDISDRKQYEKRITRLKEFYQNILQELPTELAIFNTDAEYVYINPSAIGDPEIRNQMLGRTSEEYAELKGRDPEPYRQRTQWIKNAIRRKQSNSLVERIEDEKGKEVYIQRWIYPILDRDGNVKRALGYGVDITELKQTAQQLKYSLREKNVLLQEIHHRVKNNLAIVNGLIQLQLYNSEEHHPKVQSILRDSISRVHTMGVIHDQLYQSGNLTQVAFDSYIKTLTNQIQDTFWSQDRPIDLQLDCDPIKLNINQAVPCGLLLNEILTNAFKHAFSGQQNARIEIQIQQNAETIQMRISDNGEGLPEEVQDNSPETLGLHMIQTLINQLEASTDIQADQGVTYHISFKKQKSSGSSSSLNIFE
mgnify:CR=1 FL=1